MWREDHKQDLVAITVIDKGLCYMTAVAVNNEQLPSPSRFSLGVAIKHLFQPRQP
jgi:hypothetical protein